MFYISMMAIASLILFTVLNYFGVSLVIIYAVIIVALVVAIIALVVIKLRARAVRKRKLT